MAAAKRLALAANELRFAPPVTHVYNPLIYAWEPHAAYLRQFGSEPKRILFLGMNPGPFGMVQTGIPFGEVAAVRDWMELTGKVIRPEHENPRRPVIGFQCSRSEVSGRRLWGLFAQRFGTADRFFADHLVVNYCPLAFVEATGRNRTPVQLPAQEREALFAVCDEHLVSLAHVLKPEWVIAVGDFALSRAREVLSGTSIKLGRILHPSPANPTANRDWAGLAEAQLQRLGVWS